MPKVSAVCKFCEKEFFVAYSKKEQAFFDKQNMTKEFCSAQCFYEHKAEADCLPPEEIARRARILREIREDGILVKKEMLDWM